MVAITTITALAALLTSSVTFAAPAPETSEAISKKFKVEVKVNSGNQTFDGQWLSLYHTGAGTNAVVAQRSKKAAPEFQILNGYLVYHVPGDDPNYYYTLYLQNERPQYYTQGDPDNFVFAAPKPYLLTSGNIGTKPKSGSKGRQGYFKTGAPKGAMPLQFDRATGTKWQDFTVCYSEGVAGYEGSTGNQFLWRKLGSAEDKTGQCADVGLTAHFDY